MKKRTVILVTAFSIVLFATGLFSLSWAKKVEKVSPGGPQQVPTIPKIKMAEIYNFGLYTTANGAWYWKVWVKNIGKVEYPKNSLKVQGFQILQNNQIIPASGKIVTKDLAPGEMVMVQSHWTRCCQAINMEIRFELWDVSVSPHKKLWGRQFVVAGLNVMKVNDISWNAQKKEWTATVKNAGGNTLKITIQGLATHSSPIHWVGAGGFSKLIPSSGVLTQKGHYSDYHPGAGDRLKVEIRYFDKASYCGGNGWCVLDSKEIVLP